MIRVYFSPFHSHNKYRFIERPTFNFTIQNTLFLMLFWMSTWTRLPAPQLSIDSWQVEQLWVCAWLCHPSLGDDQYFVSVLDRAQTVRYRDRGAPLLGLVQSLLNHLKINENNECLGGGGGLKELLPNTKVYVKDFFWGFLFEVYSHDRINMT